MGNQINIAGQSIGKGQTPFVIAEMSGNHNQSLERALRIVESAAKAGAHGLKLQTFTPDTMTIDAEQEEFRINDKNSLWNDACLYQLYEEAQTPWEWHQPIFERARELGMVPFSTPFDETAVDFLESLDVACYKIASFENTDLPLIHKVASTGKPMIISTGMASVAELGEAVMAARDGGCVDLVLLKCTSTYPANPEDTNALTIPHMEHLFGCQVGISDHTKGIGVSVGAVALGATVIEKHFTLRRADGGIDSVFSIEPDELEQLVLESGRVQQSLGKISYGASAAESPSKQFRRSIYIVEDMSAGDVITEKNVRIIRPGFGLQPKHIRTVLGRTLTRDSVRGTALTWDLI